MVMIQKNLYQFFIAQVSHIFDVFYYHYNRIIDSGYQGLLSSILAEIDTLGHLISHLEVILVFFRYTFNNINIGFYILFNFFLLNIIIVFIE